MIDCHQYIRAEDPTAPEKRREYANWIRREMDRVGIERFAFMPSPGDHLDDVARAHDRMDALIEDLLTLARACESATDPAPVDLSALGSDCWQHVATADASLVVETDRSILADRSRLQRLVENRFRNAVEHGGEDVTVGRLEDGFYVEDDGPGIPEDDRPEVFESGYSSDGRRTGSASVSSRRSQTHATGTSA